MSLKYFGRYRFNNVTDMAEEDFGHRDLALESGTISSITDVTYGNVLSMDGATSLLSMGTFSDISGSSSRSFSFWAFNNVVNAHNPVFSYGDLEPDNAFVVYSSNLSGNPEFYDHTTYRTVTTHTSTVSTWNLYTITYDNTTSTLIIYVDGTQRLSNIVTLDTGISDPLRIGTDGLGNYFDGLILDLEAARIDYKQDANDSSTNMSVQMRHTETNTNDTVLMETISLNPVSTTFTSVDDTEKKTSVVFSSSGVSITTGEPGGMYFGASKDFRIAVENGSAFIIQAYDSVSDQYVTKMEVHS